MNLFYSLPSEIIRVIYSFDNTYTQYFSQKIIPLVPYYCLRKEDHLLFRAKEMVESTEEYTEHWVVEETSIYLFMTNVHFDYTIQLSLTFINQNNISRFILLHMTDEDSFTFEPYKTEAYFVNQVLPFIETQRNNHIVMNMNQECYYHTKFYLEPYPRHSKDNVFIYNNQYDTSNDSIVGMFIGNFPRFFLPYFYRT